MILAVLPTFLPSAFGEVDQFHKAFDSLFFHLFIFKTDYKQTYRAARESELRLLRFKFPMGRSGDVTVGYKKLQM